MAGSDAALNKGRQVRTSSGRLQRWRNLEIAQAFVEALAAKASG